MIIVMALCLGSRVRPLPKKFDAFDVLDRKFPQYVRVPGSVPPAV